MDENTIFNLYDEIKFNNQKRILINTGSEQNYIQKARNNPILHKKYKELLKEDYILYFHQKNISKFYKRKYIYELFKRKDLLKHKNVFYTLEKPSGRKINNKVPKKLLVIFTCMPNLKEYDSSLVPKRMFPKFFDGIERNLLKNVYIMRIMDLNVSHGSHYINTINYPNYEDDIQSAIKKIKIEMGLKKENIVLYGGSKGGTGALYHGTYSDYKTLAVDPIVNIGGELEQKDRRFLKGLRIEDLVPKINENLKQSNTFNKYIICSENVTLYFKETQRIQNNLVRKINLKDDGITSHPEVSRNSVPEQIMILNYLLGGHKII